LPSASIQTVLSPPLAISLLGTVYYKVLGRSINVYLAEGGTGFKRLPGVLDQTAKDAALARVKAAFEAGKLFNDAAWRKWNALL
jgi:hypothetical protein